MIITILLSVLPFCFLSADDTTSTTTSSSDVSQTLTTIFYRPSTGYYETLDGQTHFLTDLFDFYKYQTLQQEEKQAFYFYQSPPSRDIFQDATKTARANYMFQKPFSHLDTTTTGNSKSLANDYIFRKYLDFYNEYLTRTYIDPNDVTGTHGVTDAYHLPRSAQGFNASGAYNELTHTSGIQAMVFKHFSQYCPSGYTDVCKQVLEDSGIPDWSTDVATTNPDGDINAESLLAQANFEPDSIAHSAARDYVQILSDPTPTNIIPFKSDPSGTGGYVPDTSDLKTIAFNINDRSQRSLAQYVLNSIKNRRAASSQPPGNDGTAESNKSVFEFLDDMATKRINTTNQWIASLNTTSTEGLLREIAIIEASRLLLDYMQFRQNEHIEALLAANVIQNQNLLQAIQMQVDPSSTQASVNAAIPQ